MSNRRRRYTPEEKVRILALHLLENVPVAAVCEQAQIHRTIFYRWQREFFDKGSSLFRRAPANRLARRHRREVTDLRSALRLRETELLEVRTELERLKKA